jgi:prophage antirepressor-like protein
MDIVKAFNSNELHTEIVIKGTHEEPLFRASDIGIILDISTIRSVIRDFNNTEKVVHSMHTLGGLQEVTFLTEKGLYKVLFKSRKPIAEKFQNWVCDVIKELRLKGIYELNQQLEQAKEEIIQIEDKNKKEFEHQLVKETILEREKILLKEYETIGSIFYIIKIKSFDNGQYIVKVGESRAGILARYKEHRCKYEECLLLDCFLVNRSKDFETFIKDHDNIRPSKVSDLPGHESELELFLIGKNLSYKTLLNTVNKNIKYFNGNLLIEETRKLELELEILKIRENTNFTPVNDFSSEQFNKLNDILKMMMNKIDNLEQVNKEMLHKFNSSQTKVVTGFNVPLVTTGPRLQKINPETLHLVKVYETVTEAMNENKLYKRPSINKAVNENTIYHGFRWCLVERHVDPNIIVIEPTKATTIQNLGYIAKLNIDKSEIINVYLDRKTAAAQNEYSSSAGLDHIVKNFTLSKGHYYMLYDSCEEEIKENFVIKNNNKEPILYKNGVGQFDLENNIVKEFICKYDCIKTLRISDKTLEKALSKQVPYNGHMFKYLDAKLCV